MHHFIMINEKSVSSNLHVKPCALLGWCNKQQPLPQIWALLAKCPEQEENTGSKCVLLRLLALLFFPTGLGQDLSRCTHWLLMHSWQHHFPFDWFSSSKLPVKTWFYMSLFRTILCLNWAAGCEGVRWCRFIDRKEPWSINTKWSFHLVSVNCT